MHTRALVFLHEPPVPAARPALLPRLRIGSDRRVVRERIHPDAEHDERDFGERRAHRPAHLDGQQHRRDEERGDDESPWLALPQQERARRRVEHLQERGGRIRQQHVRRRNGEDARHDERVAQQHLAQRPAALDGERREEVAQPADEQDGPHPPHRAPIRGHVRRRHQRRVPRYWMPCGKPARASTGSRSAKPSG